MRRLKEQFPNELVVIGMHSAKFPSEHLTESIREAVMRQGIDHPVVNDTGFRTWNEYAVNAWPTLVLIDPNGRIVGETSGEILAEEFAPQISEVIEQNRDALNLSPLELLPEREVEPEQVLQYPARVLVAENTLFVADTGHHRILEVRLDEDGLGGEIQRVFGSGEAGLVDGSAAEARFNQPHGLGLLGSVQEGTLYVADTENHAIRAVELRTGMVRTVAGTGQKAHGRLELGEPTTVPLRSPWAVLPFESYVLIAMAGSHQIWVLIDEQQIGPFAGNGREALVDGPVGESSFNQPSDLALFLGYLLVADPEASAIRAIRLDEHPQTVTLVGQGLFAFGDQDGPTNEALLQHATGLDSAGQMIYVADTYNHKIKALDPVNGKVETLIGSGTAGAQDGPFLQAQLFEPEGVKVVDNRLYIADTNNHRIRVADLEKQELHTFALRGLERLPMPALAEEEAQALEPVSVSAGKVKMTLDVALPEGYKRNAEAPVVVALDGGKPMTYPEGEAIAWEVEVEGDRRVMLDLSLYYCEEQDAQVCLIHNRKLVIPVKVVEGGAAEVRIAYRVGDRK